MCIQMRVQMCGDAHMQTNRVSDSQPHAVHPTRNTLTIHTGHTLDTHARTLARTHTHTHTRARIATARLSTCNNTISK